MAYQRAEFRSSFGKVITVVIGLLMAAAVVSIVLAGDPETSLRLLPWPLLGAALTWLLMWRPRVVVDTSGVEVVNPFTTWDIPWGSIRRIDTKWALELETDRGTVQAFAAPAPSRYGIASITRDDIRLARESSLIGGAIRPGDSIQSVSGAAAHVTRTHWEELRDEGRLDETHAGASRRVHWPSVAVAAVPAALVLAGTLLP